MLLRLLLKMITDVLVSGVVSESDWGHTWPERCCEPYTTNVAGCCC